MAPDASITALEAQHMGIRSEGVKGPQHGRDGVGLIGRGEPAPAALQEDVNVHGAAPGGSLRRVLYSL